MSIVKGLVFFVLLSVVSFGISTRASAQARPSPATQVASIDPIPLLYDGALMLQYEYKAGPVYSWMFRVDYWSNPDPTGQWSAFGFGAAYRVYIADSRALTGLSVAPVADIFFARQTIDGSSQRSAICFDIGGDLAYKWIFDDFSVEPIFGLRIGFGPNVAPTRATGFEPLIGVSGGYAW